MKKSDNFLSDFLFFVGVVAQVEIWEGCEEWEGWEGCEEWEGMSSKLVLAVW